MGVDQAETSVGIPGSRTNQLLNAMLAADDRSQKQKLKFRAPRLWSSELCDDKGPQGPHNRYLLGIQLVEIDFAAEVILNGGHQFQ